MNGSTAKRADADKTASAILRHKVASGSFDVFLFHNHRDKPRIKSIGEDLKAQGVLPGLTNGNCVPACPGSGPSSNKLKTCNQPPYLLVRKASVPGSTRNLTHFCREFVDRGRPVIPVVLPDAPDIPDLPIFLKGMTWVDFRASDPDPMEQLLWGITGEHEGASAGSLLPKRPVSPRTEAGSTPSDPPTSASAPSVNLAQLLVGSWQVQITNPFGMVGQMMLQIMPNGVFRGQLPTPMGMTVVEGQWQLSPIDQLSLQGRQFIGFQVMPYMTMLQLKQTAPFQLVGMTTANEQTIWQKIG